MDTIKHELNYLLVKDKRVCHQNQYGNVCANHSDDWTNGALFRHLSSHLKIILWSVCIHDIAPVHFFGEEH